MVLVFGEIFRLGGFRPDIIKQGNKLYEMNVLPQIEIRSNHLVFRDT
jgi:hypothetical protein